MKHRERMATALGHEVPDRCPMQVSFTPEFAEQLRKLLRIEDHTSRDRQRQRNTFELERALDQDMLMTSVGWANNYYANERHNPGAETYVDDWGITWRNSRYTTKFGSGFYTETVDRPLKDDAAISSYRSPDPCRPSLYEEAEWTLATFQEEYWIVGVTVCTIFETAWALRGYEAMLMDMYVDPDRANAILDIPFRYHLRAAEQLTRLGVDMIWIGDDVGGQHTMLLAPEVWRRFLKPRMARLISAIKSLNPRLKVAYHSDGWIDPIIPELIEIGIDILNPIQPRSMDPARLKTEYGDRLCFWGSIDEQWTLPFGRPDDVRHEVAERLATIGRSGGLIIGPTHHVQLDTPVENLQALVDAVCSTSYRRP